MYDEVNVNKGLQHRNRKLNKKIIKRNTVKPSQENCCRFIIFENPVTSRINGHNTFLHTKILKGLQIKNKLYYKGETSIHYIFINKRGGRILVKCEGIPPWVPPELKKLYKEMHPDTEEDQEPQT